MDGPNKYTPIVGWTTNIIDDPIQVGINDTLSKPIAKEAVEAVIQKWVGQQVEPLAVGGDAGDSSQLLFDLDQLYGTCFFFFLNIYILHGVQCTPGLLHADVCAILPVTPCNNIVAHKHGLKAFARLYFQRRACHQICVCACGRRLQTDAACDHLAAERADPAREPSV